MNPLRRSSPSLKILKAEIALALQRTRDGIVLDLAKPFGAQ